MVLNGQSSNRSQIKAGVSQGSILRPLEYDAYGTYDSLGVRLLNRLRLGFSHLREHKFRHNFADTLNPLCSCSLETEDTEYYFLRCQNNISFRTTFMNDLNNINTAIASFNSNDFLKAIFYGNKSFKVLGESPDGQFPEGLFPD